MNEELDFELGLDKPVVYNTQSLDEKKSFLSTLINLVSAHGNNKLQKLVNVPSDIIIVSGTTNGEGSRNPNNSAFSFLDPDEGSYQVRKTF
jgi:hypothetical protein